MVSIHSTPPKSLGWAEYNSFTGSTGHDGWYSYLTGSQNRFQCLGRSAAHQDGTNVYLEMQVMGKSYRKLMGHVDFPSTEDMKEEAQKRPLYRYHRS